jgi:hypothetical protein
MDDLLTRLDRFTATPTGSLTIILLTALVRILVPQVRKHLKRQKATPRVVAQGK